MNTRIRKIFRRIVGVAVVVVAGCATPPEAPPLEPLFFPPPPEVPRFIFERSVFSSADVEAVDQRTRWRQLLTGERQVGSGFSKPFDIAVCQGKVYVSDTVSRVVVGFDVSNRSFLQIGKNEPGLLRKPLGVATDGDCNVYVADATRNRVLVYNQGGEYLKSLAERAFDRLSHVAVTPQGDKLFAVDTGGVDSENHRIRVFNVQSGEHLYDIGKRGTEDGEFNLPRDIEYAPNGRLYVVDGGNFRVQVLTADGQFVRSFGTAGRLSGQFSRPKGVAADAEGNIYVSDAAFGNFQIFDPDGNLLLFIGRRSETLDRAVYMLPAGIDVDEDGRVLMVDQFFRKFDIYRPANLDETEGFLGVWNTL